MDKTKDHKAVQELRNLQELYEEAVEYISNTLDDIKLQTQELRYLREFISYKKLEDEFCYFRKHAHEEQEEDMPFPRLTL